MVDFLLAFVVLHRAHGLLRRRPASGRRAPASCVLPPGGRYDLRCRGCWLSALNVEVPRRALHRAVPAPVLALRNAGGLLERVVSNSLATLYGLNPMVGVVEGFRWALLGTAASRSRDDGRLGRCAGICCLVAGVYYFRRIGATLRGRRLTWPTLSSASRIWQATTSSADEGVGSDAARRPCADSADDCGARR